MKNFIKLTLLKSGDILYVNINEIGAFSNVKEEIEYEKVVRPRCTNIGVTTHNNGGYYVKETIETVVNLIEQASK